MESLLRTLEAQKISLSIFLIGILVPVLVPFVSLAQDKITLLNGREIDAKIISMVDSTVTYKLSNKPFGRNRTVDFLRVFSVKYEDMPERVIYRFDTETENEYSIEQMKKYVSGESDALKYYYDYSSYFTGFFSGVAGGMIALRTGYLVGFFTPAIPVSISFIYGATDPKKKHAKMPANGNWDDLYYRTGYLNTARDKRVRNVLIGGGVGFVSTLVTGIIINTYFPKRK